MQTKNWFGLCYSANERFWLTRIWFRCLSCSLLCLLLAVCQEGSAPFIDLPIIRRRSCVSRGRANEQHAIQISLRFFACTKNSPAFTPFTTRDASELGSKQCVKSLLSKKSPLIFHPIKTHIVHENGSESQRYTVCSSECHYPRCSATASVV